MDNMIGQLEFVLIVVLLVVVLKPDELIKLARFLGKIYAEYKKLQYEIQREVMKEIELESLDQNKKK
jgi:Sec-independent protein translocase protein TatA